MPIVPPTLSGPQDIVNVAITSAKVRLLDKTMNSLLPVSPRILDANEFFTLQAVNNAWRYEQDRLRELGYSELTNETVIPNITPVYGTDPATLIWLSWVGYFNGNALNTAIYLPSDFDHPLKIWERWSGEDAEFTDPPMQKILDGLPMVQKTSGMRFWEWRSGAIYSLGSQVNEDLRIRYAKYFPDFADIGTTRWLNQPIPIVRGADALSWFICAEFALSQIGVNQNAAEAVEIFQQKGEGALDRIFNLDVRADQRVNVQRRPRGRSGRGSGTYF